MQYEKCQRQDPLLWDGEMRQMMPHRGPCVPLLEDEWLPLMPPLHMYAFPGKFNLHFFNFVKVLKSSNYPAQITDK